MRLWYDMHKVLKVTRSIISDNVTPTMVQSNHIIALLYFTEVLIIEIAQFNGILPIGPYPPCLRMADRAHLAGYPGVEPWG